MLALDTLDEMLADETTMQTLRDGLHKSLERDPVWFFRRIIMPLLPKEASLQIENDGVVSWLSLSTTVPTEANRLSTTPATDASALSVPGVASEKPSALPESCSTVEP